jgi:hypothetical protein
MPTFTVKNAIKTSDKPDKGYGPMQEIALVLQGDDPSAPEVSASWYTSIKTDVPQAGARLEGDVELTQYGTKFKKAKGAGFAGGGGRSPEDRKSIVRQHSQEMALRYCTLKGAKPDMGELRKVIDWFQRDAEEGWKPKPALPPAPPEYASDVPNDFPVPTPEQQGVDPKDIPF